MSTSPIGQADQPHRWPEKSQRRKRPTPWSIGCRTLRSQPRCTSTIGNGRITAIDTLEPRRCQVFWPCLHHGNVGSALSAGGLAGRDEPPGRKSASV